MRHIILAAALVAAAASASAQGNGDYGGGYTGDGPPFPSYTAPYAPLYPTPSSPLVPFYTPPDPELAARQRENKLLMEEWTRAMFQRSLDQMGRR